MDTVVKVVVMQVHYVIEVVQNQAKYVGQATAAVPAVCVPKVAGVVLVGVQQVLHVDVVLRLIVGVIQHIQVIAELYVMLVIIVGKIMHTADSLTAQA